MKRHLRSTRMILFSIFLLTTVPLIPAAAEAAGTIEKAGPASGDITSTAEYDEYSRMMQNGPSYPYDSDYEGVTFEYIYGNKTDPPPFDLQVDLSGKGLSELRLLRNTIYARHGFLFMDSVTRGYFNQFSWYQPVFWEKSFKIVLSEDEEAFIARVKEEEAKRLKDNKVEKGGVVLGNTANIVNREMFKTMPDQASGLLRDQNFFLIQSKYEQLYYLYDKNKYDGVPNYVTTDLYLDLLHVYYKYLLMGLEKSDLYPLIKTLVKEMYEETLASYNDRSVTGDLRSGLEFNLIYLAVAGNLLEKDSITPPPGLFEQYRKEYNTCIEAEAIGSSFLNYEFFDYSQLKPRGSYEEDKFLADYFQGMKWLVTAPVFYEDEKGLISAGAFAFILKDNPRLLDKYNRLERFIAALTGEGDNLSPLQILTIFTEDDRYKGLSSLTDKGLLTDLKKRLREMDPERMKAKAGTTDMAAEANKFRVLFFPSRYNFDGYIMQNLINPVLAGGGARTFPKGLDIFAALGNAEAKKILLMEYKETETWPGYADALKKMEGEFSGFNSWEKNLFNKRMGLIIDLTKTDMRYPGFMQTSSWQRRKLLSSLAGWAEVKNEMVLYQKQPYAAEAGEGGLKPPYAVTPGYVEPDAAFWSGCLDLLNMTQGILENEGFSTSERRDDLVRLYLMAKDLLSISEKELKGETVSDSEFKLIEDIGSRAEYLSMDLKSGWNSIDNMALITDVYSYYAFGGGSYLEEGVGNADTLWVVAEINGLLYLTRGATFSYYEFTDTSRLADSEWRERLKSNQAPERPVWTKGLFAPVAPEVKTGYSDTSYPISGTW